MSPRCRCYSSEFRQTRVPPATRYASIAGLIRPNKSGRAVARPSSKVRPVANCIAAIQKLEFSSAIRAGFVSQLSSGVAFRVGFPSVAKLRLTAGRYAKKNSRPDCSVGRCRVAQSCRFAVAFVSLYCRFPRFGMVESFCFRSFSRLRPAGKSSP